MTKTKKTKTKNYRRDVKSWVVKFHNSLQHVEA